MILMFNSSGKIEPIRDHSPNPNHHSSDKKQVVSVEFTQVAMLKYVKVTKG
jgi:hypothetical protein